jgi:hypothetical protein
MNACEDLRPLARASAELSAAPAAPPHRALVDRAALRYGHPASIPGARAADVGLKLSLSSNFAPTPLNLMKFWSLAASRRRSTKTEQKLEQTRISGPKVPDLVSFVLGRFSACNADPQLRLFNFHS